MMGQSYWRAAPLAGLAKRAREEVEGRKSKSRRSKVKMTIAGAIYYDFQFSRKAAKVFLERVKRINKPENRMGTTRGA